MLTALAIIGGIVLALFVLVVLAVLLSGNDKENIDDWKGGKK